jgi:hypothetical protein
MYLFAIIDYLMYIICPSELQELRKKDNWDYPIQVVKKFRLQYTSKPIIAYHPGEYILEELRARGWSQM